MTEFIDKTLTTAGTPINRKNMMAIQGFQDSTFSVNADGSITETNDLGYKVTTTFNSDGSITERFVGEKTITRTTSFVGNEIRVKVV